MSMSASLNSLFSLISDCLLFAFFSLLSSLKSSTPSFSLQERPLCPRKLRRSLSTSRWYWSRSWRRLWKMLQTQRCVILQVRRTLRLVVVAAAVILHPSIRSVNSSQHTLGILHIVHTYCKKTLTSTFQSRKNTIPIPWNYSSSKWNALTLDVINYTCACPVMFFLWCHLFPSRKPSEGTHTAHQTSVFRHSGSDPHSSVVQSQLSLYC